MKNYYFHIFVNNSVLLSDLPENLREEAERCTSGFAHLMCPIRSIMKRQKKEIISGGYIYMCSYDTSMTNKIFSYYFDMLKSIHTTYEAKIGSSRKHGAYVNLRRMEC